MNIRGILALILTLALFGTVFAGCTPTLPVEQPPATKPTEPTTQPTTQPTTHEKKSLNILFLGNSLIYYNDMPLIFKALAQAGGKDVVVESVTTGSATMSDFASPDTDMGKKMREKLAVHNWDYVIIEPSRRISPYEDTVMAAETAAAKTLQAMAADVGAKVILYAVWGTNTGKATAFTAKTPTNMVSGATHAITHSAHTNFMHDVNRRIAAELGGVMVVEAGYAFENLMADPSCADINLYHGDKKHPSPAGSYLAAAAFYAAIYGEPAASVTTYNGTLPATTAATLRAIADKTVLEKVIPSLDPIPAA